MNGASSRQPTWSRPADRDIIEFLDERGAEYPAIVANRIGMHAPLRRDPLRGTGRTRTPRSGLRRGGLPAHRRRRAGLRERRPVRVNDALRFRPKHRPMNHESYLRAVGLPEFADVPSDSPKRGASLVARPRTPRSRPTPSKSATSTQSPNSVPTEPAASASPTTRTTSHPSADWSTTPSGYATTRTPRAWSPSRRPSTTSPRRRTPTGSASTGAPRTPTGRGVLVKEAYVGEPSRAEFPLTESFAERSNNSSVGLSGEAVLVEDVAEHDGPYYECDDSVRSGSAVPSWPAILSSASSDARPTNPISSPSSACSPSRAPAQRSPIRTSSRHRASRPEEPGTPPRVASETGARTHSTVALLRN